MSSYDDDTGAPTVLALPKQQRKAKKEHECSFCAAAILPGDYYDRQFVIVDGEPDTVKSHTHCFY